MKKSISMGFFRIFSVIIAVSIVAGCQTTPQTSDDNFVAASHSTINGNSQAPFSIGVVPLTAPPIVLGSKLRFQMSTSSTGYGHLYLINASGNVLVLAENMIMKSGQKKVYPNPKDHISLRANPPAGTERVILLVTRQPLMGFNQKEGQTTTRPVALAITAGDFIRKFNQKTAQLPSSQWSVTEIRVRIYKPGQATN